MGDKQEIVSICGYCKKEVEIKGWNKKKKEGNTVLLKKGDKIRMLICPHCNSILGITYVSF